MAGRAKDKAERPPASRGPRVAFVTTCKGRRHHLEETLPLMAAQQPAELVVVDYDCPAGAGAWAEAEVPAARVVRAGQPDGRFNVARARNLGAATTSAEWLMFLDADIRVAPDMLARLGASFEPGCFYTARPVPGVASSQTWGSFACPAAAFAAVGGYDEVLDGWGHEDEDLYARLTLKGLRRVYFTGDLVSAIEHDDTERDVSGRGRWENEAGNACYAMAKREISRLRGGDGNLPLEERRKIMQQVRPIVAKWYAEGARQPLSVRFGIASAPPIVLGSRLRVAARNVVTVVLEPAAAR